MKERTCFLEPDDLIPAFLPFTQLSQSVGWGLIKSGIPEAHRITKGSGIKVAILDTGGTDHEDLIGNVVGNYDCTGHSDAMDRQGHGTHVAGIVAAKDNDLGVLGVAPEVQIYCIKVLDNSGHGGYDTIEAGIRKAIELGVDIINMSLGSASQPPDSFHNTIKDAYDRGIFIVAAAGNDGKAVNWPARYDEVIAIGALDRTGNLAHFSSRSDEVDAVAPGVDIYACHLNKGYAKLNGTSQACPFMAGVCALLLAWSRKTPDVPLIKNYQDMLQRLDDVCDRDSNNVAIGRSGEWGFGIPSFANNKFRP